MSWKNHLTGGIISQVPKPPNLFDPFQAWNPDFLGLLNRSKNPHVVGFDVGVKMSSWILRDGSALFLDRLVAPKLFGIDINRDHHMLIFINTGRHRSNRLLKLKLSWNSEKTGRQRFFQDFWVGGNLKNNIKITLPFDICCLKFWTYINMCFFLSSFTIAFTPRYLELRRATKCNDLLKSDPTILVHKTCLSETHRHGFVKSWLQKFVSDCTSARRRVVRISLWTGYGGSTWNIQFVGIQYGSNHRTSDHDDWGGTITFKKQGI